MQSATAQSYNPDDYDWSKSDEHTQTAPAPVTSTIAPSSDTSGAYNPADYDWSKSDERTQMGEQPLTELQQGYNDEYHNKIAGDRYIGNFNLGPINGPIASATNSTILGLGPALVGLEQGVGAKIGLLGPDAQKIPFGDIYNAARGGYQNSLADYAKAHPWSAGISNLAGAIPALEKLIPEGAVRLADMVGIKGGQQLLDNIGSKFLGRVGQSAATGAARGLGDSVSQGADLKQTGENMALGGALSGITSGTLEGVNGLSNIAGNLTASPLSKTLLTGGLKLAGGSMLGAAGASALHQDPLLGATLGGAGATALIKNSAGSKNSVDDLDPETQQGIVKDRLAQYLGGGDANRAADILDQSKAPTILQTMTPTNQQGFVNHMTPSSFDNMNDYISTKQGKLQAQLNSDKQNTANTLKDAIAQHTGVTQSDAASSVAPKRGYVGNQDQIGNLHNVYTSIDAASAGHPSGIDPMNFYATPHGQLFDTHYPDTTGNFNDALTKYGSDLNSNLKAQNDLQNSFNGIKNLQPPMDKQNLSMGQAMGLSLLADPQHPISSLGRGALAAYDYKNSPEVMQGQTPINSDAMAMTASMKPSDMVDRMRDHATTIANNKAAVAQRTQQNQSRIRTAASALTAAALPTNQAQYPKPKPNLMDGVGTSDNATGNFHPPLLQKDGTISRWNPDLNKYVKGSKTH